MKALLRKLKRRMSRDFPKRSVIFDPVGFSTAEEDQLPRSMRWDDVDTVFSKKIDLFSYDEIQLGFGCRKADRVIEVGEHHEGFAAFLEEVMRRYDSIPKDWFSNVAFPAFDENFRILWERNENGA